MNFEQRVERQAQTLLQALQDSGRHVTPDLRVSVDDCAWLIGWKPSYLRNVLSRGHGPRSYRLGGCGHRRTVKLVDLAEWMELRGDSDDC